MDRVAMKKSMLQHERRNLKGSVVGGRTLRLQLH